MSMCTRYSGNEQEILRVTCNAGCNARFKHDA